MGHFGRHRTGLTAATSLAMFLASCGGDDSPGSPTPAPSPAPVNAAPAFTSATAVAVDENASGTIYTATGRDPEGSAIVFAITGGSDAGRFRISGAGALSFVDPPDFEAPTDADADNRYIVQLSASDGSATATLTVTVTVINAGPDAFRVRRIATGFDQPLFVAPVPDGSGRVFVVERQGRIRILTPSTGATASASFLDIRGTIATDGERGLLGFAPAPDFVTSGVFYIYVTAPDGTNTVRRYRAAAGNRDIADAATGDVILAIPHPGASNHNGGWIGFGPDGFLYVASGDGGGANDPARNAQNPNLLLGKILRIDPTGDAFPGDPERDYAIPVGNPFAGSGGRPEIWASGVRNPFRNSFDPGTGNLLIADVGQDAVEEIDLLRPGQGGANLGWPFYEGTRLLSGQPNAAFTAPVAEYGHGSGPREGDSVTGGYVYRGPVEALRGQYVFADFVRPNLWSIPVSRLTAGQTLASGQFTLRNADFRPDAGAFTNIASFGVDQAGNLYIVDLDGEIFVLEATG